jgi:hypothetical protein
MRQVVSEQVVQERLAALSLMQEALELLDRSGCTLELGAHLDLAICRLQASLGPFERREGDCHPASFIDADCFPASPTM